MDSAERDIYWMQQALLQAEQGAALGEVPVGAVLVLDDEWIASGFNRPISTHNPSAHAEIEVLRAAGQRLQNYRLTGSTLYVTLEPCPMCVGALVQARISRLVYATTEPKNGALGSALDLPALARFNHAFEIRSGVCAEQASRLLSDFFASRRAEIKLNKQQKPSPEEPSE